jgi:P-type conjugative transfer protein TrbJ
MVLRELFGHRGRKVVAGVLVSALLLSIAPQPARAGGLYATEITQLLNHVELVLQYEQQIMLVERQFTQLQNELKQAAMLPQQFYNATSSNMTSLMNVVQGGNSLAYSMSNLDDVFNAKFGTIGYQPTTNYQQRYTTWSQTTKDSTQKALDAAHLQSTQITNDAQLLAQLESSSQSASGQMQALQVANQLAAMEIDQLMKLRQLMMADLQSKSSFQMQQQQMADETMRANGMFKGNTLFVNSGGIYGANK